jgi:hypothetical protein
MSLCCYRSSPPFLFQLRTFYYTLMRSVEDDEDVQRRGVVGCNYCVGGDLNFDLPLVRKIVKLRNALPARFNSVHVCYNDPLKAPVFALAMFIMRAHSRRRFRTHCGSDEECQRQLSSFGIPISALPVSPRGEFNLENHRNFVAMQRAIEATNMSKGGKGPLRVAQKGKEKTRCRHSIIKEDVFAAVPQPSLDAPTAGHGGSMSFSNMVFLQQASFAIPWWNVVGVSNLSPLVPSQSQLPLVPQSHMVGPTIASRPPANVCESLAKPNVIYDPLPYDILSGRGKPIQQRPGNIRFREMIDTHKGKYEPGEKGAKTTAIAFIMHLVEEEGGRFIKELEGGGWVEVDEATARAKVDNAFRTCRQA